MIDGTPMLDLEYSEDVRAEVDMNVVMTGDGRFVEVQGTAEGVAFTRAELDALLGLAESGIAEIIAAQQEMVAEAPRAAPRDDPLPLPLVLATQNADKAREIVEILVDARRRAARRVRDRRERRTIGFLARPPERHRGHRSRARRRSTAAPDVEETGATLEENARIKARGAGRRARAARDRRRHRARGRRARRRARRVLGALRGRATRPTPTTSTKLLRELEGVVPDAAHRPVRDGRDRRAGPTAARSRSAARSRA